MAKRRKSSKRKSSKCPEPFNTLIDLAGGLAMNAIANRMEEKHHYRKRGVPNPYRASAFGISTGRLNSTEDIIRLGGLMGAMGSFDDDPYATPKQRTYDVPWQFDDLGAEFTKPNNNRYAWRLNCEDGHPYGINPNDYETKVEYNTALEKAKKLSQGEQRDFKIEGTEDLKEILPTESSEMYVFCKVSRLDNGRNEYFLVGGVIPAVGDTVIISDENGNEQKGVVLSVEQHSMMSAPQEVADTSYILRID